MWRLHVKKTMYIFEHSTTRAFLKPSTKAKCFHSCEVDTKLVVKHSAVCSLKTLLSVTAKPALGFPTCFIITSISTICSVKTRHTRHHNGAAQQTYKHNQGTVNIKTYTLFDLDECLYRRLPIIALCWPRQAHMYTTQSTSPHISTYIHAVGRGM